MPDPSRRMPTFDHVAMSVPADLLEADGRAELLRFYGEVFGWTEMPGMTLDRERMVLRVHSNEQFVFLIADAQPMACPRMDHFGLSVAAPAELYETVERARTQGLDARRALARFPDSPVRQALLDLVDYGVERAR